MDLLKELKDNLYETHPSTEGYFESVNFQFAKIIFAKRIEKGITQQELANFAGVSLELISMAETGSKGITLESYDNIFAVLGIVIETSDVHNQLSATI